jgi:uncharacterized membrane protein HdeD (DUF308 family)
MEKQTKPKSKLEHIFENQAVQITFGLASILLAYIFASWAINSGSLLDYAIGFLFFFAGIRELVSGLRKGKRQ